ncbi:phosphoenolpyruvate synthase [Microbacterium sp. NEAU-LLC]|uniref:Phosphoenolpyruvate synthase n=2 Tax=Microbacterium helvum TaxID=2773713 RepID=A0ABR8NN89_9MICO|nr:phosphoenolpyruvate synthase [Microbacterium helvum]
MVAPLTDFGREDLARAGGKGANLGELIRAGMPVPDGFVVTTDAYAAIRVPDRDRASYERAELPAALERALADAYRALGEGAVAVRSSATAEDLPGAAFAGQQDTYLNVVGHAELRDAVRRCWGSLWTDRAVAYRDRLGIAPEEVRIAVVVQRMVDADVAGVMFTADPVTGDRDRIVVEAGAGLGEAVVSGLVTPDRYVLSRDGAVQQFTPGRSEVVVRPAAGGGLVHETGGDAASIPVLELPRPQLAELARRAAEVAALFGRPQDIEWAIAAGRIWLLQARPMTALPPPPVRGHLNPLRRRLAGTLLEFLPWRPYPMDMSTWVPHGPAGLMAKVTESIGLRGAFEGFLRERDGVVTQLVPPRPHPTPRIVLAPFLIASRARRHDPARWEADPRYVRYRDRVRELAAVDVAELEWNELVGMPRHALALVEPVADLRIDYLPASGVAFVRLIVALKLARTGLAVSDLLLDGRSATERANRDLEALAALVRADPGLARRFAAEEPRDLVPAMQRIPQFTALLAEHGHRESASPLLATSPTWGEAPEIVVGLVKVLVAAPDGGGEDPARRHASRERPRIEALSPRLQRRIERARVATAFREDSHYEFTRPLPILRAALLELGRRLAAAGVLDDADDIWHLRLEEVEGLPAPGAPAAASLRARVRARSARRDELAGTRLIDPRVVFPHRDSGDALVAGEPAGTGRATGPARIITGPAEFGRLQPGEVLVCPYTNPSWTPLFQRAVAVVVDSGGIASHAAIVAREYGIPAVMGTAVGSSTLRDGQLVTVDGDTGRVTAADDTAAAR